MTLTSIYSEGLQGGVLLLGMRWGRAEVTELRGQWSLGEDETGENDDSEKAVILDSVSPGSWHKSGSRAPRILVLGIHGRRDTSVLAAAKSQTCP